MQFYVYELRDHTGLVFYVGKGRGRRMRLHGADAKRGYDQRVHRKIRKLWENGHDFEAVKIFETNFNCVALAREIELIAFYGRENLTNLTDGGEGTTGRKHSEESKELIAATKRGKKQTPEHIQAMKEGLARAIAKRKEPCPRSAEWKRKQSLAQKGRMLSEEHREAIRRGHTGLKYSPEHIQAIKDGKAKAALRRAFEAGKTAR